MTQKKRRTRRELEKEIDGLRDDLRGSLEYFVAHINALMLHLGLAFKETQHPEDPALMRTQVHRVVLPGSSDEKKDDLIVKPGDA